MIHTTKRLLTPRREYCDKCALYQPLSPPILLHDARAPPHMQK